MILLATAALATASPPNYQPSRSAVTAQATATIRIVSGITLKLGLASNPGAPPTQDTTIRSLDGSAVPAKLIEFQ